jgi:hypothetical protein
MIVKNAQIGTAVMRTMVKFATSQGSVTYGTYNWSPQ